MTEKQKPVENLRKPGGDHSKTKQNDAKKSNTEVMAEAKHLSPKPKPIRNLSNVRTKSYQKPIKNLSKTYKKR